MSKEIASLSHSFESLQTTVLKELDSMKVTVSQLCEAVVGAYPERAIPKSIMAELQAALSSQDLFTVITRHSMWNYVNHHLLEHVVKKTVPQNNVLQREIEIHKASVETFLQRAPIHGYIDSYFNFTSGKAANVMPVHEFPPDPAMFVPFQFTLTLPSQSQSMGVIMRLQSHVMKHFSLPHPTLLLGAVSRGSTVVTFHFPRVELERVTSLPNLSSRFFSELNVESVTIDSQLQYQNRSLPLPTHEVLFHIFCSIISIYDHSVHSQAIPSMSEQHISSNLGQFPGEGGM